MHNIIIKGIIKEKIIVERSWNSYIEQTKNDTRVKTFKNLKEKTSNQIKQRIGVINQPTDCKKGLQYILVFQLPF